MESGIGSRGLIDALCKLHDTWRKVVQRLPPSCHDAPTTIDDIRPPELFVDCSDGGEIYLPVSQVEEEGHIGALID